VANGLFDEEEKDIIEQLAKYDPANPQSVAFVDGLIAQNTDAKTKLEQAKAKADADAKAAAEADAAAAATADLMQPAPEPVPAFPIEEPKPAAQG